jgi:uncharacterized protein
LDPKEIQTSNFTVQPVYQTGAEGRPPVITGYEVTNSVRVTVHDIAKLGPILDEMVTLGANEMGAIEFGVSEPDAVKDEARKIAVSKAMADAKLYAEAAGGKLGKVLTISEDEGGYVARYAAPAPMSRAGAAPIEAGTTTIAMRIHMTFELE